MKKQSSKEIFSVYSDGLGEILLSFDITPWFKSRERASTENFVCPLMSLSRYRVGYEFNFTFLLFFRDGARFLRIIVN